MGRELSSIQMGQSMKGSGRGEMLKDLGFINTQQVPIIKVTGNKIHRTGRELKFGQIKANLKEILKKGENMEKGNINGQMGVLLMGIGLMVKLMGRGSSFGQMGSPTKGAGETAKCMDMADMLGKMEEFMRVCIRTIKSMEREHFTRWMDVCLRVNGSRVREQVRVKFV